MPLRLQYQASTPIPVEVEGLTPTAVAGRPLSEVERFPIHHGNRQLPLAELFAVSGSADDGQLIFEGDLSGVHWIGAGMDGGVIRIQGHAGRHLGSEMTAGEIHCDGNAGDWVGAEMHGGLIYVRGNAGHLVGAAYRGSRRGMTRGTILVEGSAGNEIGHTMRRGTIVIGGNAGDAPGFNMIAGTIFVLGACGIRPGAGMRRGTIGLFGPEPPPLLPTFRFACRFKPNILRLAALEIARLQFPVPERLLDGSIALYHGDLVALGKGEIWIAEA
jgi:formylmethanofuran dehydrogenase subunit C